jgi:hypothetical protein
MLITTRTAFACDKEKEVCTARSTCWSPLRRRSDGGRRTSNRTDRAGAILKGSPGFFRGWIKETKRVRFGIVDVVLAVLAIIFLVLVIRQLIY